MGDVGLGRKEKGATGDGDKRQIIKIYKNNLQYNKILSPIASARPKSSVQASGHTFRNFSGNKSK